ncbi:hypothetical protein UFOVP1387_36 [uncultured Caudovirales phage]|jgi:hypothetical protein|uniref:Uncharacterized protein n=1 Tax=uncultured Caudovirales phage TaxID=2100421 RepID=A0A6J5S6B1_9CAUD|nr:hypothetical protein UFOVP1387_36 [uncultured Caudovirales phage]
MDSTQIVVAVITAVGGVIAASMHMMRRENRDDHALVVDQLRSLHKTLNTVGDKVDRHLTWHLEGQHDTTTRRDKQRATQDRRQA